MAAVLSLHHNTRSPIHLSKDNGGSCSEGNTLAGSCQRQDTDQNIWVLLELVDCIVSLCGLNLPINPNIVDLLLHHTVFNLIHYFVMMAKYNELHLVLNQILQKFYSAFNLGRPSHLIGCQQVGVLVIHGFHVRCINVERVIWIDVFRYIVIDNFLSDISMLVDSLPHSLSLLKPIVLTLLLHRF